MLNKRTWKRSGWCINSDTYDMYDNNDPVTINKHSEFLQKMFKLEVSHDKVLPSVCWISKLHKNSTKARFIIAFAISSLKPLTKTITSAFKVMYQIVQKCVSILVFSLDFPIVNTKMHYSKLLKVLNELTGFCWWRIK